MVLSAEAALALTLGMSLIPTVLFLGLWRGLMYLRDDELVEEMRRMQATEVRHDIANGGGGSSTPTRVPTLAESVVVCEGCGAKNAAGMTYCWHCLARVDRQ